MREICVKLDPKRRIYYHIISVMVFITASIYEIQQLRDKLVET